MHQVLSLRHGTRRGINDEEYAVGRVTDRILEVAGYRRYVGADGGGGNRWTTLDNVWSSTQIQMHHSGGGVGCVGMGVEG